MRAPFLASNIRAELGMFIDSLTAPRAHVAMSTKWRYDSLSSRVTTKASGHELEEERPGSHGISVVLLRSISTATHSPSCARSYVINNEEES
jgi:hypothetical protein